MAIHGAQRHMLTHLHFLCLFNLVVLAIISGCSESTPSTPNPYSGVYKQIFLDDISIKGIRLGASEADIHDLVNNNSCWTSTFEVGFACDGKVEVRIADIDCKLGSIRVWNGLSGPDGEFYVDSISIDCPYGEKSLLTTISHRYGNDFTYTEADLTKDNGVAERAYEDWYWKFPSGASLTLMHYVYGDDDLTIYLNSGLWPKQKQLIDKLTLEDI